ncbi:MAG TPA: aspartate kinase, partial [Terriglobales bacterium]|nr:aspartate kinase [Terriglobales bacterium]
MATIVMKFGGTSVQNAERIRRAASIVAESATSHIVVVVVSALAKTTDDILECMHAAASGQERRFRQILENLDRRHHGLISELLPETGGDAPHAEITKLLEELERFCQALFQLRSLTPQLLDVALPVGEKMSAHIFTAVLRQLGLNSSFTDSSDIIVTDDRFGDASVNMEASWIKTQDQLRPVLDVGTIPVITGYSGSTQKGQPTTLGRGGSDTTATVLGSLLQADEIWIWTDVDGVLTADPRVCSGARVLREITFAEAIELSYYGAKVIHHKAVHPARESQIPVWIKNSFNPAFPGTKITVNSTVKNGPIKAVTAMAKTNLITVAGRHGLYVPADILGRLFMKLGHERVDILFSTQSSAESSLGLMIREEDTDRVVAAIEHIFRAELKQGIIKAINVERNLSVIAVLGERMKGIPAILGRLFSAVSKCDVNVIAAAQGATEM